MNINWIEGATHYNHKYGGFFLDAENNRISFDFPIWKDFSEVAVRYWTEHKETVHRHPNEVVGIKKGEVVAIAAKVSAKKQVGWWS